MRDRQQLHATHVLTRTNVEQLSQLRTKIQHRWDNVHELTQSPELMKLIGIVLYLLILLLIGAVASRRMKDLRDYYAGGKRFGFWAAAFSSRATGESAWLLIGLTGMGAAVGAQALWVVLGEVLGVAAAWIFLCGRFKRLTDRYDSITIPDYLESRLRDTGHQIRLVAAFTLVVFVTIYVSAQIDAIGTAFESFLGWNYFVGAIVGFAVVLVYIVSGGFVAVVWSDVFQGSLMVVGLVALPIFGLASGGGVEPAVGTARQQDPLLLSLWGPGWPESGHRSFTILGFLAIGLGFMGSPQIFVRFLSLRSVKEIRPGAIVAILWTLLADTGAVLVGMVGRALLMTPSQSLTERLGQGGQQVLPMLVAERRSRVGGRFVHRDRPGGDHVDRRLAAGARRPVRLSATTTRRSAIPTCPTNNCSVEAGP